MRRRTGILAVLVIAAAVFVWFQYRTGRTMAPTADAPRPSVAGAHAVDQPGSTGDRAATRRAAPALLAREAQAEAFGAFDGWAASYLAETDVSRRRAMIAEGVRAAGVRRAILHEVIATDPQHALSVAVPWGVRRDLPAEIQALLEERVDGIGAYRALATLSRGDAITGQVATRREVEIAGTAYETFTYGARLELGSRDRLAVHGIALDGRLALLDSPVRVLDSGEPVPANRRIEEVCAVSGRPTRAATAIPADTGDRVIYLCSAGHISLLASQLEGSGAPARDAGDGGAVAASTSPDDDSTSALEVRRVLMIRIRFADQAGFEPETGASAAAMFAAADSFYQENSFGQLRIEGTVSPVYTLPETAAWYLANDTSGYALNVLNAARAVAAAPESAPGNAGLAAFNYLDYDFEAVRYTGGPGTFSGQGYVAMRGCWLKSAEAGVLIHELGHNLGLWHANAWKPADPLAPLGAGANAEYGDTFDTMGPARGGALHFNGWEKKRLGWLTTGGVATVAEDATLTLAAIDVPGTGSAALPRALRVTRDGDRDTWFELRRHAGWGTSRPNLGRGLGVRWDPWLKSNGGTQLIDTTPGSADGFDDATLAIGRTYSDVAAGIHVTPLGANAADPSAIDVAIHIGSFAGNHAPAASIAASATDAGVGQSVRFIVTATDPDGDALSYSWSFDGGADLLAGTDISYAWPTEGDHRARVTVSDRRGGTASASVFVRVGAISGSRITGRVLDLQGKPVADVVVNNGTEPGADGYRSAWSDADGSFALLGVPGGRWELGARAAGWILGTEGFTHPVSTPQDTGDVTILGYWRGFSITGTVRRADGEPLAGALVRTGGHVEPTDQFGEFTLTGLAPGRHTLTVEAGEAVFEPEVVEVGLGDVEDVFLSEETFEVAGRVAGGANLAGVTVTNGWQSASVSTVNVDGVAVGRFQLSSVPGGSWSLRGVSSGGSFAPPSSASPLHVTADISDVVLGQGEASGLGIAGVVRDCGRGLAGAIVSSGGVTAVTDSRGGYWLGGLVAGVHEVTVSAEGATFAPATRSVTVASTHLSGIDFATTRVNQAPVFNVAPHVVGLANQPFFTVAAEATDDEGAELVRYWWGVVGDAPGGVEFAVSGANAARQTVVRVTAPGDYALRVTAVDRHGAETSAILAVTVEGAVGAPVITEAARANPALVGSSLETRLSVRATSEAGDEQLTYTWSLLAPDGSSDMARIAGPVAFSANMSAAARETTVRFRNPGNYLFRVAVEDQLGQMAESMVAVRVEVTYDSWLSSYFDYTTTADLELRATIWGELADPDGDGVVNLLEYAFGGDPTVASPDTRPRTHFVTEVGVEYLAVTFRPNPDAIDLVFEPQVSSDLQSWAGGLVFVPGDDDRVLTYRDAQPAADHERRFIRVNVSRSANQLMP